MKLQDELTPTQKALASQLLMFLGQYDDAMTLLEGAHRVDGPHQQMINVVLHELLFAQADAERAARVAAQLATDGERRHDRPIGPESKAPTHSSTALRGHARGPQ